MGRGVTVILTARPTRAVTKVIGMSIRPELEKRNGPKILTPVTHKNTAVRLEKPLEPLALRAINTARTKEQRGTHVILTSNVKEI